MDTGGNTRDSVLCALLSEAPVPIRHNETTLVAAPTYRRLL